MRMAEADLFSLYVINLQMVTFYSEDLSPTSDPINVESHCKLQYLRAFPYSELGTLPAHQNRLYILYLRRRRQSVATSIPKTLAASSSDLFRARTRRI